MLDSLAFLSPAGAKVYDVLALKIVHDLRTCALKLREHQVTGDIRGLCGGVWALAAYYGGRDRQLYPRLTVDCVAEIMQLDHPNNTAGRRCQYTPHGTACLVEAIPQTAPPVPLVVDCMEAICHIIRGRVLRNQQAVHTLMSGDSIVKVLAGVTQGAGLGTTRLFQDPIVAHRLHPTGRLHANTAMFLQHENAPTPFYARSCDTATSRHCRSWLHHKQY